MAEYHVLWIIFAEVIKANTKTEMKIFGYVSEPNREAEGDLML